MNTEYITIKGDRWDTVAFKAYGDASRFREIIEANPDVPVTPIIEQNTRLNIPIIEKVVQTDTSKLPPWKR